MIPQTAVNLLQELATAQPSSNQRTQLELELSEDESLSDLRGSSTSIAGSPPSSETLAPILAMPLVEKQLAQKERLTSLDNF